MTDKFDTNIGVYTRHLVASLLVLLMGVLPTYLVVQLEQVRHEQHVRYNVLQNAGGVVARLESLIESNLAVVRGIRAELSVNPAMNQRKLNLLTEQLIQTGLQIRHIALAPDLIIEYVYPLEGNEKAIGLNYRTHPAQREAVMNAIALRSIVLAGPVNLVQGGQAFIARVPVFLAQEGEPLWGMIAAVIRYQQLMEDAGIITLSETHHVAIRGANGTGSQGQIVFGDNETFDQDSLLFDVKLPTGSWQMAVKPKSGWDLPITNLLLYSAFGLLLSSLAAVVVFLFLRSKHQQDLTVKLLERQASFDFLTGLPNRYMLNRHLSRLTESDSEGDNRFCLLFIDLDNFKEINDSLGHNLGDELLTLLARRLEQNVRSSDTLARLGGDEFVVVLNDTNDPTQAEMVTRKIIDILAQPFKLNEHELSVTVSIGLAFYPQDGKDAGTLLQHADRALYAAKDSGRNTLRFFNIEMRNEADRHIEIHQDILAGLQKNQFDVHYQPIQDLNTGQFTKVEALIRWYHPEKGWISPGEFIPVAESTGSIRQLGIWLLDRACGDLKNLHDLGYGIDMTINRSVNEFCSHDTIFEWLPMVQDHRLEPSSIIFEITESLLTTEHQNHMERINLIKSQGFKLAIDDFGTGYSGINYLRKYPVDYLKIDSTFVQHVQSSAQDRTLFEVIVNMADALGLETVTEGVETQDQLEYIQLKQCQYAQGFFLARPMPYEQLLEFLANHRESTESVNDQTKSG